jgi:sugar (pentulose or hexulose) kinase
MNMKFCAAIDLGASSGRVAVGSLDSDSPNLGSLVIKEVHRFNSTFTQPPEIDAAN